MKILIVDNEALTLQVLQLYAGERLGHQTVGVRTGREALALLDCQDFDLLIIGLNLPDIEGFEILKRVRQLLQMMELPILVISENLLSNQIKSLELGANDYLSKPLEMQLLLLRVRSLLRCRSEYLTLKRGVIAKMKREQPSPGEMANEQGTLQTLPTPGNSNRLIPCEVPVLVFQEDTSHFCKTLKIGQDQLTVLAFNEIPRANGYLLQMVHPTGETMEIRVSESRRREIAEGAAGSLALFMDIVQRPPLFEQFCNQLDNAWRVNGLNGLKEVLRGSMSLSHAGEDLSPADGRTSSLKCARYRHLKLLWVGGFATVFLVRDLALQRDVAMKILSPELAADESAREKFLGEARIAAQFHHPNIVFVYEVGNCDKRELPVFLDFPAEILTPYREYFIYFTMQYIEGESLAELVRANCELSMRQCAIVFHETLRALSFAHGKGVIHRDIKPGNIMIDENEHIIVTDFGIARLIEDSFEGSNAGLECTPRYASPEQLLGRKLDGRSDIYSLGITLYEILSGAPPFEDNRMEILVARQLNEDPPNLMDRVVDMDPLLAGIVMRCISKNPDDRYENVDLIIPELQDYLNIGSEQMTAPAPDTLTLLLDRALLLESSEEAEEVMEKLVAHLNVHQGEGEPVGRMKQRIAQPAVIDALLTYGLRESLFPLLYRFFGELSTSLAVRPLLRWFLREHNIRVRRYLSRLAVLSSGDSVVPLVHGTLDMKDEDAALILRALREMGRGQDSAMIATLARHPGERTRLELLHYIRSIASPSPDVFEVVHYLARTATHESVRESALKLVPAE